MQGQSNACSTPPAKLSCLVPGRCVEGREAQVFLRRPAPGAMLASGRADARVQDQHRQTKPYLAISTLARHMRLTSRPHDICRP
jgi:hypothetical protein